MFIDFPLRLVEPAFDDDLVTSIVELEGMRRQLRGSTSPFVFFDLKGIYQLMDSLASSRIEGNRTTIADLVDSHIDGVPENADGDPIKEILNIDRAAAYVEESIKAGDEITHTLVKEMHAIIVDGLAPPSEGGEGDPTPGAYRKRDVEIARSDHTPPTHPAVTGYLDELLGFINDHGEVKYQLLRIALAHHRFAWIHPFTNGNGRVVRMLTYAMLIQQGFNVAQGRTINPSAVLFSDRDRYYDALAEGDKGTDDGLLKWCSYMLGGLQFEMDKIARLLDYEYLSKTILIPAVKDCADRGFLDKDEEKILLLAVRQNVVQAKDIAKLMPKVHPTTVSRRIKKLRDRNLLVGLGQHITKYRLFYFKNDLTRSVIRKLQSEGFFTGLDQNEE